MNNMLGRWEGDAWGSDSAADKESAGKMPLFEIMSRELQKIAAMLAAFCVMLLLKCFMSKSVSS